MAAPRLPVGLPEGSARPIPAKLRLPPGYLILRGPIPRDTILRGIQRIGFSGRCALPSFQPMPGD